MPDKTVSPLHKTASSQKATRYQRDLRCSNDTTSRAAMETAYLKWGSQAFKLRRLGSLEDLLEGGGCKCSR